MVRVKEGCSGKRKYDGADHGALLLGVVGFNFKARDVHLNVFGEGAEFESRVTGPRTKPVKFALLGLREIAVVVGRSIPRGPLGGFASLASPPHESAGA